MNVTYLLSRITISTGIFILSLCVFSNNLQAQALTQTIRGTVLDEDAKFPLAGATVVIPGTNPAKGVITDVNGEFRIAQIPVGRYDVQIRYLGYEEKTIPNVVISSGKEVILSIEMKESVISMNEIVVTAQKKKGDLQNEMALISSRSFSVEETKRYAGSFQDPSRMVAAYAGVTSDPLGNNDIVVRGNSPKGILWRMEGIEIPNPNHFSNEGSTGGAISALNSELLSNSDFYTGAFAPEYGDALSGVFDMRMRPGNNEKKEYSIGVGVLGTDITAEGPFSKNYRGSYLVNYRYSSLAMLDKAGLVDFDGVPKFQDGAFKVVLPTQRLGTTSVFGMGGLSSIDFSETESKESERVVERGQSGSKLGVLGMSHTLPMSQNSFLKLTLSASGNGSNYNAEKIGSSDVFGFSGKGDWKKSSLRSALMFSSKINSKNRVVIGAKYTGHSYNVYEKYFDEDIDKVVSRIDMRKKAYDFQTYVSWKYRLNNNLTMVGGLHGTRFSLNREFIVEPRLSGSWQINSKHAISAGFGMHSKSESIITYYAQQNLANGESFTPNTGLALSKARHYVVGYEYRISKNMNSKIDFYYQDLYDIPVENLDTSNYSILNSDEGYMDLALVNKGKGTNYGVEYTLERYFADKFYFMATGALFQSTYTSLEGKTRNTKFNSNYAFNFLAGKEFNVGKSSRGNVLAVNFKFFFNGGRRYIPVDLAASKLAGKTVFDYSRAWDNRLDNLTQLNFSCSYRVNRAKTSHEFIIDVVNLTSENSRFREYYNKYTGQLDYNRQMERIPNIMYRIHF